MKHINEFELNERTLEPAAEDIRVIAVTNCYSCPYYTSIGPKLGKCKFVDDIPFGHGMKGISEECPLECAEDFAESHFNIDR